jgi:Zn-dependent protease
MIYQLLIWGLPLILALTLHEVAHGVAASLLGDPTARIAGRLSLNPLRHVSVFSTVLLPALSLQLAGVAIGWARPVPVSLAILARRPYGIAMMAAAGPAANIAMALLWLAALRYVDCGPGITLMCRAGVLVNAWVTAFNLLPLRPLDGWLIWQGRSSRMFHV